MPLGEVRLLGQEPNWVKLLSEENISPERHAEDGQGHQDDDYLHGGRHNHLGYGFEDGLKDVLLGELVRFKVLVFEAG